MFKYDIKNKQLNLGFTIVELLVVIAVIGILASITIVSYVGITQQANVANIKADISQAASKINVFHSNNGVYPTGIDDCQNTDPKKICIEFKSGNEYNYSSPTPNSTFVLDVNNGVTKYRVDNTSAIPFIAPSAIPITAIAAISGTPQAGSVLMAGAITPSGSVASYQWQSSTSSGGHL